MYKKDKAEFGTLITRSVDIITACSKFRLALEMAIYVSSGCRRDLASSWLISRLSGWEGPRPDSQQCNHCMVFFYDDNARAIYFFDRRKALTLLARRICTRLLVRRVLRQFNIRSMRFVTLSGLISFI